MWLASRTGVVTYFCFSLTKELANRRNEKRNPKNQRINSERVKDSIMIEEIISEDIEKTVKSVLSPDEVVERINNMEKKLSNKANATYYGLYTNKTKYLKNSKLNESFIDRIKELGISKSTILFKKSIAKLVKKYLRRKKPSLSLHVLKNNFKICHGNSSEFK